MNNEKLFRLQRIFREVFDDPAMVISPELSPAATSDWDSVAMVQIVLATEEEFGVRLSMEIVAGITSVADLLRAVEQ